MIANQIENALGTDRIDIRGRFVGQQQLGLTGHGAGDGDTLLLPDRQLARAIIGAVGKPTRASKSCARAASGTPWPNVMPSLTFSIAENAGNRLKV